MSDWEVRLSTSRGVPYFFNTVTKQSSWEPPAGLTPEKISQLPGAKEHLSGSSAKESSGGGGKPGQVRASHLLVKHRDSRRPSSWKEANITRTKEEAIEILRGYEKQIGGSPDKFAELAEVHSDCSSHANGGDLGWFGRGQMQKPFEDAAYGIEVGQISEIISSDSGVHLVLRTG
ncbi:Peptidyl-prolyl cis-trans isomerase ssp-1 [Hypsizygus marmoreus]|uniref:Peptidyl-prolyl cis-trans isomerase n=1 Tax=Hypsizygus marmoreus TaxID=39966 RepID=A0A369JE71_HYPMA|nr:Peptidyl-prolyl cis-trans isomerase ssp-1 [Hypsizygus marmoreus]